VIVDLEDAVAPDGKDAARAALSRWLAPERPVVVRINGADTPWFAADLALCAHPGVSAVMLPKAETAEAVAALVGAGATAVLPLVESAAAFSNLSAIAAGPRVAALVFGSIDLQLDLGMSEAREDDLQLFRVQLVLASRLAGIAAPVDGVTTAIDDEAMLRDDTQRARRLGFSGKLCIHPRQVRVVNEGFAPSTAERAWAQRVVEVAAAGQGSAVAVDGKMVDKPVLMRAQAILRETS
jgi:citrate lyase subunit beta/citryl-CoA lyase